MSCRPQAVEVMQAHVIWRSTWDLITTRQTSDKWGQRLVTEAYKRVTRPVAAQDGNSIFPLYSYPSEPAGRIKVSYQSSGAVAKS